MCMQGLWPVNLVMAAPYLSIWGRQKSVFLFSGRKMSFFIVIEHKVDDVFSFTM